MAIKKKTTKPGPKALLMKKSLPELKRKAKALKIKGYSTKKKEQIVQSIILAEARKKRSSTPKRRTLAGKQTIVRKRGARPNKPMKKPVQMRGRRNQGMSQGRYTEAEFLGSAYYLDYRVEEAANLLKLLSQRKLTKIAEDFWYREGTFWVCFNEGSGIVFLRDEEMNVLIQQGNLLELFLSTPYEGVEGTYDELMEQYEDLHPEDQEYLDNYR